MNNDILSLTVGEIIRKWDWAEDFFTIRAIDVARYNHATVGQLPALIKRSLQTNTGHNVDTIVQDFVFFFDSMKQEEGRVVKSVTILPGKNKDGAPERKQVRLVTGEVTTIVGPTGSGKSRLLEDIECFANRDTPTGRKILINDEEACDTTGYGFDNNLIAGLSQNMNFVMDVSVRDFLSMHAESRMAENAEELIRCIYDSANELAGEQFALDVPVTQLSGGQSRALMIADTALLSPAPIILIDEIENAGIDKIQALKLLVKNNKIVLMATHDPLLALSSHRRIVIYNGGIEHCITTTAIEKELVSELSKIDSRLTRVRRLLRNGNIIENI